MKRLVIFALGALLSATAPVIPSGDMTFLYAYEHVYEAPVVHTTTTATGTLSYTTGEELLFPDKDGDGKEYVAVFREKDGALHSYPITKQRYNDMGKSGGASQNPRKVELQSFLDLLLPAKAQAAIARDATSQGGATATSLTVAHTNTGSNLLLFAGVVTIDGTTDRVTGVTYNGVAMTRQATLAIGTVARSYGYYLLGPATGANNIVISTSASVAIQSDNVSYNGVAQTGFPDASNATTATDTNYANTLTTVANNAVHILYQRVNESAITNEAGGLLVLARGAGGEGLYESLPLAVTPAGSHSITFTSVLQSWAGIGISVAPAAEPAAASITSDTIFFE